MASITLYMYRKESPEHWLHEFKPHLLHKTLRVENTTGKRLTVPRIQRLLHQAFPHVRKSTHAFFLHKRPEGWTSSVVLDGEEYRLLIIDNESPASVVPEVLATIPAKP